MRKSSSLSTTTSRSQNFPGGDTEEAVDEASFSLNVQMIGCVPVVAREVRLLLGIRADDSGLLIPALTVHSPDPVTSGRSISLKYREVELQFDGFMVWSNHSRKLNCETTKCLYTLSVMRTRVFVCDVLRNWTLATRTHDEDEGVSLKSLSYPMGQEDIILECFLFAISLSRVRVRWK